MNKELSYWLALAHTPRVKTIKKNEIVVRLFELGKTLIDFFHLEESVWKSEYDLTDSECYLFKQSALELSNYAFMVEQLLEQGYNIIPIRSKDYSPILKKNLGREYAPSVIYTKGNLQIMKEESIAIVGSRKANDTSLSFTDSVAKKASSEYKVVVSGFAKGVDKQALDSALKYNGRSIIVLPQGITTFTSGFKKYYKKIIDGDVLVLSIFFPKAPWSVQLAMARNPIIYGLSSEIYVAESSDKGGTWSGVIDGLRKGRTIYVRDADSSEKNANGLLIQKGAKAVDNFGNLSVYTNIDSEPEVVAEPKIEKIETAIINLLKNGSFDSKSIVERLNIEWSSRKVTSYLKHHNEVETLKVKPLKFTHKERTSTNQTSLF